MSNAVARIEHIRGETITFGLRSIDPPYDGSEIVTCDVKVAVGGVLVPPETENPILSISPRFSDSAWLFTITASQSAGLNAGKYITDARIEYEDGFVDYPRPLLITLAERVTA